MKISVPHIPQAILAAAATSRSIVGTFEAAVQKVDGFLAPGNAVALTGAGVSVDSGIRAYRGKDGSYMNPNYRPIFYHELIEDSPRGHYFRQRYWCRSYLGYPPVARTQPNPAHFSIAALQYTSHISRLITQNVDGLHLRARPASWSDHYSATRILELHGTLHSVHCRRNHVVRRDVFQNMLSQGNPRWKAFMDNMEATGQQPRTNPDGDVELEGATYDDFVIPACEACLKNDVRETIVKPSLTFFGDTLSKEHKERSFRDIEDCDRLLLVGTTLATYSAFRLFKHALELSKPILILNVGPTRADPYLDHPEHRLLVQKVEWRSGEVLRAVASRFATLRGSPDRELTRLLTSGLVTPIDAADDDRAPRAAG